MSPDTEPQTEDDLPRRSVLRGVAAGAASLVGLSTSAAARPSTGVEDSCCPSCLEVVCCEQGDDGVCEQFCLGCVCAC